MNCLASSVRTSVRTIRMPHLRRTFSLKPAEFITISAQGSMASRNVDVWLGEPHQAFVLLPTDIGNAMKAGCAWKDGLCLVADPQICTLTFYHDTQHFAHESIPYPRIVIPQNLPRQSDANTSPATLYLFGATHTIALDGTPDADFAKKSKDTLREMKPVLDNFKER